MLVIVVSRIDALRMILLYGNPVISIRISCACQLSFNESVKNITTNTVKVLVKNFKKKLEDLVSKYSMILHIMKHDVVIKTRSSRIEYNIYCMLYRVIT
jgi:hypothetical protein